MVLMLVSAQKPFLSWKMEFARPAQKIWPSTLRPKLVRDAKVTKSGTKFFKYASALPKHLFWVKENVFNVLKMRFIMLWLKNANNVVKDKFGIRNLSHANAQKMELIKVLTVNLASPAIPLKTTGIAIHLLVFLVREKYTIPLHKNVRNAPKILHYSKMVLVMPVWKIHTMTQILIFACSVMMELHMTQLSRNVFKKSPHPHAHQIWSTMPRKENVFAQKQPPSIMVRSAFLAICQGIGISTPWHVLNAKRENILILIPINALHVQKDKYLMKPLSPASLIPNYAKLRDKFIIKKLSNANALPMLPTITMSNVWHASLLMSGTNNHWFVLPAKMTLFIIILQRLANHAQQINQLRKMEYARLALKEVTTIAKSEFVWLAHLNIPIMCRVEYVKFPLPLKKFQNASLGQLWITQPTNVNAQQKNHITIQLNAFRARSQIIGMKPQKHVNTARTARSIVNKLPHANLAQPPLPLRWMGSACLAQLIPIMIQTKKCVSLALKELSISKLSRPARQKFHQIPLSVQRGLYIISKQRNAFALRINLMITEFNASAVIFPTSGMLN